MRLTAEELDLNACISLLESVCNQAKVEYLQGIRAGYRNRAIERFFLEFPYSVGIKLTEEDLQKLRDSVPPEEIGVSRKQNNRRISEYKKDLLLECFQKGMGSEAIVNLVGVSYDTVRRYRLMFESTGKLVLRDRSKNRKGRPSNDSRPSNHKD